MPRWASRVVVGWPGWSGRNIEFGIVPVGALLIAGSTAWLALGAHSLAAVAIGLFLAGVGSGLYVVPLEAFLQWRSPPERRGEVSACPPAVSSVGWGCSWAPCSVRWPWVFSSGRPLRLPAAELHDAGPGCFFPQGAARFLHPVRGHAVTRVAYRLRVIGLENLPVEGGALLVSNHVSFMDALQILAVQQRRIRFMMHRSIYEGSRLKPLFKLMGVIPIAMEDPPKKIVESLREARRCLGQRAT